MKKYIEKEGSQSNKEQGTDKQNKSFSQRVKGFVKKQRLFKKRQSPEDVKSLSSEDEKASSENEKSMEKKEKSEHGEKSFVEGKLFSGKLKESLSREKSIGDQTDKRISQIKSSHKKKKSLWRRLLACGSVLLLALVLLVIGIVVGVYFYPKGIRWLSKHGFVEDDTILQTIDSQLNGNNDERIVSRDEIETENVITKVASDSVDSVVSIVVTEVALTRNGIVDQRSEIGSGFVVDAKGLVVTNQHVVSDLTADYIVVSSDGIEYTVSKIYSDDVNDIALLEIDLDTAVRVAGERSNKVGAEENNVKPDDLGADKNDGDVKQHVSPDEVKLKALNLGDTDDLKVGQTVIAIGTPLGDFGGSVTTGVISGLNRSITTRQNSFWGMAKVYEDVIQTDAAINPGNSGGPLLDLKGNVIGVSFATISGADNISFALPSKFVKVRLDEYYKYGKFIKPYLGLEYKIITPMQARFYNQIKPGALVLHVASDSPAADAGIKKGDIVIQFGGQDVSSALSSLVQQHKVNDKVDVVLWRITDGVGKEVEVSVTLREK